MEDPRSAFAENVTGDPVLGLYARAIAAKVTKGGETQMCAGSVKPAHEVRPAERGTKQRCAEAKEANARAEEFPPTKGARLPKIRQRGAEAKAANAREGKFPVD